MPSSNSERLTEVCRALRPLLSDLVFVGGCVTEILVTDRDIGPPRLTLDVDAVAEITSYAAYTEFGERLRALGFSEDSREGAPVCRWLLKGIVLDVMPLDEKILGFSNPWYPAAMKRAFSHPLTEDLMIRVVTAPCFLATKLVAFRGRGKEDYIESRDLEDLLEVIGGRSTIVSEVLNEARPLRTFVQAEIGALIKAPVFLDAIPCHLRPDARSQARLSTLVQRLKAIAEPR